MARIPPKRALRAQVRARPKPMPHAGPGAAAPAPVPDPFDYSADPILQRIRALGQQRGADAEASATRLRQEAELDFSDAQNRLGRDEVEQPKRLTENLNRSNLFYSSEFGKQQGNLATGLLENRAAAGRRHNERLGGIESGLLGARRGIADDDIEAEEGAAGRLRDMLGDLPMQRPQRQPRPQRPQRVPRPPRLGLPRTPPTPY